MVYFKIMFCSYCLLHQFLHLIENLGKIFIVTWQLYSILTSVLFYDTIAILIVNNYLIY